MYNWSCILLHYALELFVADSAYVPPNDHIYWARVSRVGSQGDVSAMDRPTVVRDILHIVGGVQPSAERWIVLKDIVSYNNNKRMLDDVRCNG